MAHSTKSTLALVKFYHSTVKVRENPKLISGQKHDLVSLFLKVVVVRHFERKDTPFMLTAKCFPKDISISTVWKYSVL